MSTNPTIYFSDYFGISPQIVDDYGAVDVSLISDLPLFIDPFLLFSSEKPDYVDLHSKMINYLVFLKEKSSFEGILPGLLKAWFTFPEVKQNWFGYALSGNGGSGLGIKFAKSLNRSYRNVLKNFGSEELLQSSHLEKVGLIQSGIGKDNISDFTTNLIKEYLLSYTQEFAKQHLSQSLLKEFNVEKVYFNYETETWISKRYTLPAFGDDYILLTPKDILTLDEMWINRNDLSNKIVGIIRSLSNEVLRDQLNNYINKALALGSRKMREKALAEAINRILEDNPELIDVYIKLKEDTKGEAKSDSSSKVAFVQNLLINQVRELVGSLNASTNFYEQDRNTYDGAYARVIFLKDVIENKGGWRSFYVNGKPVNNEGNLQIMYRLAWFATILDVNREVNNGTGPVDFSISNGRDDKTLVEFKLATNSKLFNNLANQTESYEKASDTRTTIKAILYFDDKQLNKVNKALKILRLTEDRNVILIDASPKESASNLK